LATLTLLLPTIAGAEANDTLLRWISRGDQRVAGKPGREAALRECFEFIGDSLPAAALTRSLDANDAASGLWLRADPAYAVADAVTARLLACGALGLSREECDELARTLRPLFGDAGFPLEASTCERWYLHCPADSRLPKFAVPEDVLGDDLMRHLPQGENERQWRHLLNEAQVILHNHPVNERRVQRGQVPANSLWFWGAGKLPEWVRTKYTNVFSSDDAIVSLARLANVALSPPSIKMSDLLSLDNSKTEQILVDFVGSRDFALREQEIFSFMDTALRNGRITALHLIFETGERYEIKRAHRWRFWRRIKRVRTR
jgi:hypothetical protein